MMDQLIEDLRNQANISLAAATEISKLRQQLEEMTKIAEGHRDGRLAALEKLAVCRCYQLPQEPGEITSLEFENDKLLLDLAVATDNFFDMQCHIGKLRRQLEVCQKDAVCGKYLLEHLDVCRLFFNKDQTFNRATMTIKSTVHGGIPEFTKVIYEAAIAEGKI